MSGADGPGVTRRIIQFGPQARPSTVQRLARGLAGIALAPPIALAAAVAGTAGMRAYVASVRAGLAVLANPRRHTSLGRAYSLLFWPLDSTRYAEFDFFERCGPLPPAARILDVSSPRLLPCWLLRRDRDATAHLLNPDAADQAITRALLADLGLIGRCTLDGSRLDQFTAQGACDLVTCMSVLEHIADDAAAVRAMWNAVAPGGRLVLTVPCRAEAEEQYTELNQYGVLDAGEDGLVFRQRLYSTALLAERILATTGPPARIEIWGETAPGYTLDDTLTKWRSVSYPFWAEPLRFRRHFARFTRVEDLPGEGVVGLEFVKPAADRR